MIIFKETYSYFRATNQCLYSQILDKYAHTSMQERCFTLITFNYHVHIQPFHAT